jgi:putative DNA methylase
MSALVHQSLRNLRSGNHSLGMVFSRRRLPHAYAPGKWLFVTWHLHGSLPHGRYPPPGKVSAGKAFVWMDGYLDRACGGPLFLKQPELASMIVESLHKGIALGHYSLGAFVVMANHVHVLLQPRIPPSRLLQSLKGFTAREANRRLDRTGKPFWQAESYDHWVRDEEEYRRIAAYIESNPVKAGLVARAEDHPWSSANTKMSRHDCRDGRHECPRHEGSTT